MGPPPAPFELELSFQRVIKAPPQAPGARTNLSCVDAINCSTATARAWGFRGARLDAAALEAAVQATVADLPVLAGRLAGLQALRLGSLYIDLDPPGGGGALLTVVEADEASLDCMGPDTWPQRGITLSDPAVPFYIEAYDSRWRTMGSEPLMKVRLTRVSDGDILAITLCHCLTDGVRWPALTAHLATRYRHAAKHQPQPLQQPQPQPHHAPPPPAFHPASVGSVAGAGKGAGTGAATCSTAGKAGQHGEARQGQEQDQESGQQLLLPTDRRLLSPEHMAGVLSRGEGSAGCGEASTPPPSVHGSLAGYWRLAHLLLADSRQAQDLLILHIPRQQVATLKQAAAGSNPAVTTGDAVQAAAALLLHAALGRPLLPVAPSAMVVLVQLPTPPGYWGNAVHMLPVSVPKEEEEGEAAGSREAGQQAGMAAAVQAQGPGLQQKGRGAQPGAVIPDSPPPWADRRRQDDAAVWALRRLAGAIRRATAAFRAHPGGALRALQDTQALVSAPAHRMLSYLAAHRMPHLTCTTNYVPGQQGIELGVGQPAVYVQGMTMPRARDMAVIRPAVAPYSEGLFLQLSLAPEQAAQLEALPLLGTLLPQARWVGQR